MSKTNNKRKCKFTEKLATRYKLFIRGRSDEEAKCDLVSIIKKHNILSKCIAFAADNANVNFGGLARRGGQNVYSKLKLTINSDIIGVGCPAHVLHNCMQHGADSLRCDIDYIIFKIYNYFSIYTVRTETLKEFCDFVEVTYQQLLYHSKTRWLSMFPAIERILKLYPALESHFQSLQDCPVVLKRFFDDDFSELYLYLLHSTMNLFHVNVALIEKENISVLEVHTILSSVLESLRQRLHEKFIPFKIRTSLNNLIENGYQNEVTIFKEQVLLFYNKCVEYLEKWSKPLEEFKHFDWMLLNNPEMKFNDILPTLDFLLKRGIDIDDTKLIDEFVCLKQTVTKLQDNEEYSSLSLDFKWAYFFKSLKHIDCCSELLKITQFYFAIPSHNAAVERVFSLISAQWTKERNRLSIESIRGIIMLKYNMKMTCEQFHGYLLENTDLLKKIGHSDKYLPKCKEMNDI